MIRVQTRIATGLEVLQYFTTRQWHFKNDRLLALREELKGSDKETYAIPFEDVDTVSYMRDSILGARQYVMKEDPANLPRARRTLKMMWLLDRTVTLLFYLFIAWVVVSSSHTVRGLLDTMQDTVMALPIFRRSSDKSSID